MVSRLMLGCGTIGHALIDDIADRDGSLNVVDGDESRIETLRTEGINAETGDVTDPDTVGAAGPAEVVVIADDSAEINLRAAEAVRSVLPDVHLVAYVGDDAGRADRRRIATQADRTVAPGTALVDGIEGAFVGDAATRARALRAVLTDIEGSLGIFTHDNPDPDALASGVALKAVAATVGVDADICYYGEISHQENQAFVNLLDLELRALDPEDPVEYDAIALVDHSQPGVNDQLPTEMEIDIVVDHHPAVEEVEAPFVDHREAAGATSTLLTDYVRQFDVAADGTVATGLLYGIRVDTKEFRREVMSADFEAAAYLLPRADDDLIERIESPSLSAETLETIAAAIRDRRVEGAAVAASVGAVGDRDTLAQAADRLLAMEGIAVTMVCGYTGDTIYVSARSTDDRELGAVLRRAFGDIGSAGGHTDMAGAQVPLGLFEDFGDDTALAAIVGDQVTQRFFTALRDDTAAATADGIDTASDPDADPVPDPDGDGNS